MAEHKILFAGFGGQGLLFAGKVAAYAGLSEDLEVSWLPSYGPEARGGTSNCSVCLSDKPIGSPLITEPTAFIAMNLPSFDKFIDCVVPGGVAIIDSQLVGKETDRTDITVVYRPFAKIAEENGLKGLANIIMLGKLWSELKFCSYEALEAGVRKSVPATKAAMVESNLKALKLGIEC